MKRKLREKSKMPSQRQLRVGELFRHRLSDIFMRGEVHQIDFDTRLIMVTEVSMSADLRNAKAYIMMVGGAKPNDVPDDVSVKLNEAARFIRPLMSDGLRLKYVPELVFIPDERFAQAEAMQRLLATERVQRDLKHDLKSETESEHGV